MPLCASLGLKQRVACMQPFYLIMNVAVGGVSGFFPDGVGGKPWADTSQVASTDFWNARNAWLPSWKAGASALQVHVRPRPPVFHPD